MLIQILMIQSSVAQHDYWMLKPIWELACTSSKMKRQYRSYIIGIRWHSVFNGQQLSTYGILFTSKCIYRLGKCVNHCSNDADWKLFTGWCKKAYHCSRSPVRKRVKPFVFQSSPGIHDANHTRGWSKLLQTLHKLGGYKDTDGILTRYDLSMWWRPYLSPGKLTLSWWGQWDTRGLINESWGT